MKENDYSKFKLVDDFDYDTNPNEKGEILVTFKVDEENLVMPISRQTLKNMLWYAEQGILCVDCGVEEKNPGLDICGSCYHERIWG